LIVGVTGMTTSHLMLSNMLRAALSHFSIALLDEARSL
jgi:hypothetical protein